jgi:SAM-dependent methyltransferase
MRFFTTPKKLYDRLEKRYSDKNACILDVGVGGRKFLGTIGTIGTIGIDIRPNSKADIVHDLNIIPWPLENDKFDLILCRHILEHLLATDKIMEELYRICKPGGKLVIEVPHFSNIEAFRHWQHIHFFTAGSFDYFSEGNKNYKAFFRIVRRRIFFDDISKIFLIEIFANKFLRLYERHFAFIFPAGSLYFELEKV